MENPEEDWFTVLVISIYNAVIFAMAIKWVIPQFKEFIKR